ncbi:hypothetical protein GQ43DRAFT_140679 [Delitschia confertaspora ATCC 74209]|uniref:Uncharacterized protein n=1 Tax=Delitschia confertaspora ATCC 74209 TaxID=1513339 RepID=A0A9P4JGT9_9PLEO|nr:hypothetical protein GQ43DRAFT_140679 [Delitschia confertaspora ATCC 74209]
MKETWFLLKKQTLPTLFSTALIVLWNGELTVLRGFRRGRWPCDCIYIPVAYSFGSGVVFSIYVDLIFRWFVGSLTDNLTFINRYSYLVDIPIISVMKTNVLRADDHYHLSLNPMSPLQFRSTSSATSMTFEVRHGAS